MIKEQETHIQIDDCSYHLKWIHPEQASSKCTLVFLHDALGSIPQWKMFPETIVKSSNVSALIIERRGYGKSSPYQEERTKNYLHHEAWVVLPKLLKQLKVDNPLVIGHSDGATIALLYAAKYDVIGIISIAAHVFVEEKTIQGIKTTLQDEELIKQKLKKYHHEKVETLFETWHNIWLSETFFDWNIEWDISHIKQPILVIQSKDDIYGTLEQVERIKMNVKTNKIEELILESGGHAPHLSQSNLIINPISEFIKHIKS